MKLSELVWNASQGNHDPDEVEVVVDVEAPFMTVGARPVVGVSDAGFGFDWENGLFRIIPTEKVMCVTHDVPQHVLKWEDTYICPKCDHTLSRKRAKRDVKFCSYCGQAVKWNE